MFVTNMLRFIVLSTLLYFLQARYIDDNRQDLVRLLNFHNTYALTMSHYDLNNLLSDDIFVRYHSNCFSKKLCAFGENKTFDFDEFKKCNKSIYELYIELLKIALYLPLNSSQKLWRFLLPVEFSILLNERTLNIVRSFFNANNVAKIQNLFKLYMMKSTEVQSKISIQNSSNIEPKDLQINQPMIKLRIGLLQQIQIVFSACCPNKLQYVPIVADLALSQIQRLYMHCECYTREVANALGPAYGLPLIKRYEILLDIAADLYTYHYNRILQEISINAIENYEKMQNKSYPVEIDANIVGKYSDDEQVAQLVHVVKEYYWVYQYENKDKTKARTLEFFSISPLLANEIHAKIICGKVQFVANLDSSENSHHLKITRKDLIVELVTNDAFKDAAFATECDEYVFKFYEYFITYIQLKGYLSSEENGVVLLPKLENLSGKDAEFKFDYAEDNIELIKVTRPEKNIPIYEGWCRTISNMFSDMFPRCRYYNFLEDMNKVITNNYYYVTLNKAATHIATRSYVHGDNTDPSSAQQSINQLLDSAPGHPPSSAASIKSTLDHSKEPSPSSAASNNESANEPVIPNIRLATDVELNPQIVKSKPQTLASPAKSFTTSTNSPFSDITSTETLIVDEPSDGKDGDEKNIIQIEKNNSPAEDDRRKKSVSVTVVLIVSAVAIVAIITGGVWAVHRRRTSEFCKLYAF